MADRLVLVVTTLTVLGSSSATPDIGLTITNSTYPMQLGGALNLTCTSRSDDLELGWAFQDYMDDPELITDGGYGGTYIVHSEEGRTTLSVQNVTSEDFGIYHCYVRANTNLYTSFYFKGGSPMSMVIDKPTPMIGEDVTLMCRLDSTVHNQIEWYYTSMNGDFHDSDDFKDMFGPQVYVESKTSKSWSSLEVMFYNISVAKSGNYTCTSDDGFAVTKTLLVRGVEAHCTKTIKNVALHSDAVFNCKITTVVPFEKSDIVVKKKRGMSEENDIDTSRVILAVQKDDNMITKYVQITVQMVTSADDNMVYIIRVNKLGVNLQLKIIIINLPDSFGRCDDGRCRGDTICDAYGKCICPKGSRPDPDPDKEDKCIESTDWTETSTNTKDLFDSEESDGHSADGGGDVTIVKHSSVATAVGVSMGILVLIILIILGFVCYWRRKKHKLAVQTRSHYLDPNYLYQYEYHSEANTLKENPTVMNPGYQIPPPRPPLRKENTYVDTERARLEFPRERLQLGVDLGQGRFGKVIQARAMNISGHGKWEKVAVKTCRGTATDSEKQDLYQELEIMRKISIHPNVVQLLGCCSKTDPLYIIIEYVQRGCMLDYLRKCRPSSRVSRDSAISSLHTNSSFMEPRAKDLSIFALQIARGMAHVASCGIIHRDLAVRNILLATDFTCKICDFGLARDVEGVDVYERTSKGPLPIRWMAPEALADNMYTRKSDVWSYGVLLWEVITLGATPYTGMSAMDVMRHVLQGFNLPRPLHCKPEMYELMERCWTDADERPTFSDIVSHHEALMDDDYIILSDYDEGDYGWLDSYTLEERV